MNIKPTLNYMSDTALDGLYTIKRANEWITASKVRPAPRMLFGECWFEGEITVLTGPSGVNKSVLAVQIGESVAGGKPDIGPFSRTAACQPVLYIDLKLSEKQFEMRYAGESEPEDEFLKDHYQFFDNFHRIEVDLTKRLPEGVGSWADVLPQIIERTAKEKAAKVVIIDDITALQTSVYGYRETPPLMRELSRLKREMGLSILVLATDPGLDTARTPTSLRLLERFADSVFSVGRGRSDAAVRYIKQLRSRSSDIVYDSTHVPSFLVVRSEDNFIGFELLMYDDEKTINNIRDDPDWPTIDRIKQLSDEGNSIRKIAEIIGESKTTVHRWLQLWQPVEDPRSADAAALLNGLPDTEYAEDALDPYHFPGREEYTHHLAHPRFNRLYRDYSPEQCLLQREYGDIDNGRAEARKEWLETGKAPTLNEMLIRKGWIEEGVEVEEKEAAAAAAANEPEQEPSDSEVPEALETAETTVSSVLTPLHHHGRHILVETFYEDGKPHIWYDKNKSGQKIRVEQGLFGTSSTLV